MKLFFLGILLLAVEIFVVGAMVQEDWVREVVVTEQRDIIEYLGAQTAVEVKVRADELYRGGFVDTGIRQATYELFIPTQSERDRSGPLENMGASTFSFAKQRLDILWTTIYQLMIRLAVLSVWGPFFLLALAPAVFDGLMSRQKKKYTMGFASPFKQRLALLTIGLTLYVSLLTLFAPFPLAPYFIPTIGVIIAVAAGMMVSNIQKTL